MCSTAGDIEDITNCSTEFQNKINKDFLKKCKKCSNQSTILLQKKDPFCQSCFYEYCNHKFRSTIGKSKKIKHGEKVLLGCSGGRKSAALLHMTIQTLKSASARQISFSPAIIFIDESFIEFQKDSDPRPHASIILKRFKEVNYPVLYSSLEMVYKINTKEDLFFTASEKLISDALTLNEDLKMKLSNSFEDMPLSSKMDLLKHLRLLLITEIACQTGCNSVFLGDTASSLAVDLLSGIALGRGSQISSDTCFYDTRYKVPVCRPLREFLNKEIGLYNHLNCTTFDVFPDFLTKTSSNSSIQRLTETFLTNLQENFPATVFTVFRTGGKLSRNSINMDSRVCIVCRSELDNADPDPCSALEALKISQKLSSGCEPDEQNDSIDVFHFMCHGCSVTFQRMSNPECFHSLITDTSLMQMNRDTMKGEIKDYLIEDNC